LTYQRKKSFANFKRSRIGTAPEPASSAGSQSREPGATPNKSNISDKRVPKNDTREDIFDGPNDALFYDTVMNSGKEIPLKNTSLLIELVA
jgi:hypothetical protein